MSEGTYLHTGPPRLKDPWLTLARLVWLALVTLLLGITFVGLPRYYQELLSLNAWISLNGPWDPVSLHAALSELRLTPRSLAAIILLQDGVQLLTCALVGALIFWRKSHTWLGLFASFVLIGIGTTIGSGFSALEMIVSPWREVITFLAALVWPSLFIFFFIFPDGRFVPRWMVFVIPLWAIFFLFWAATDLILAQDNPIFLLYGYLVILFTMAGALYSQVYRYLRVSGPIERQQTRLFTFSLLFAAFGIGQEAFLAPFLANTSLPLGQVLLIDMAFSLLGYIFAMLAIPVAIAIALFRYRLWEIDLVIRRTLIYGLLTAALALVYTGSIVILQNIFVLSGGEQSTLAIVLSTLAIAALFNPLRAWIQRVIDQRFYRRRYDAEKTLAAFEYRLRTVVDLDQLNEFLVDVASETMKPETTSVWIRKSSGDPSH